MTGPELAAATIDRFVRRLHARLGSRYRHTFLLAETAAGLGIAVLAVLLVSSYYRPSASSVWLFLGVGCASTTVGVWWALWRGRSYLVLVVEWQEEPAPTHEASIAAWDAATNFPMRSFRANALFVSAIAALPIIAVVILKLKLSLTAAPTLLAACVLPAAYGTVLNYVISETLMRPWIEEIAAVLPDDFPFDANGLLIRKRLKLMLPVFTGFVGFVVAALMTGHGGTKTLAESVGASIGVGLLFSFELTALLSRSVTGPISALRRGLAEVRAGDYDVRVPVATSDELGELSHDFNLMASGLAERERMREAFGTYLDHDVVPLILSGQYPSEGVEVTVTIMFVDVLGFTAFAERAAATEVVAALNALFEVMVPIVREHGGHIDKFIGDGMMAVFGAPEGWVDHADRAVAAALEIVRAVNRPGTALQVGVGINTGRVVAGSIGGGGRLNFSVVGDAVNVAARVEAATRQTGDQLLLTAATRDAFVRDGLPLRSRGTVPLKGKAEPVEVLACAAVAADGRPRAAQIRASSM